MPVNSQAALQGCSEDRLARWIVVCQAERQIAEDGIASAHTESKYHPIVPNILRNNNFIINNLKTSPNMFYPQPIQR